MERKNIAVLCDYKLLPNRIGGMDYFFWQFDEEVKKLEHQIDWFFPNGGTHGNYSNFKISVSNEKSIEYLFLNLIKKNGSSYDIIFCHFLELCTPFYKKLKKALPNSKVIVIDHNPRPLNGFSFKRRLEKRVKGLLHSRYIDKFIGVSQYTINEILKDFGKHLEPKTQLIYNGILTERLRVKHDRNHLTPKFFTACHLRYSKGIQDLVQAVNLLSIDIKKDLVIDIYGDGDYKDTLFELITTLNLESNFTFRGNSSNLGELFCNYDYLIQPTHMECFSLGILESLAANIPVITTPVGGNLEVVKNGENGFIFSVGDYQKLSMILENIVSGKISVKEDTTWLIRSVFTLENMTKNYLVLIE